GETVEARTDLSTALVEEAGAEALEQSGARVGGGAAAGAHEEAARARVDRSVAQLAEPTGGGGAGRERAARPGGPAHCSGELEHGDLPLLGPAGGPGLPGGAGDLSVVLLVAGGERGVDRAVAAVGDRAGEDLELGCGAGDASGERGDDLGCGERALE